MNSLHRKQVHVSIRNTSSSWLLPLHYHLGNHDIKGEDTNGSRTMGQPCITSALVCFHWMWLLELKCTTARCMMIHFQPECIVNDTELGSDSASDSVRKQEVSSYYGDGRKNRKICFLYRKYWMKADGNYLMRGKNGVLRPLLFSSHISSCTSRLLHSECLSLTDWPDP